MLEVETASIRGPFLWLAAWLLGNTLSQFGTRQNCATASRWVNRADLDIPMKNVINQLMECKKALAAEKYNRVTMTKPALLLTALFWVALPACADILPFLSTYTGTPGEDLNIQSANATFDGTNFEFTSTVDAAVGTTPDVFYVWGVDRGLLSNEALFGSFAPNILFDSVVILDDIGGTPGGEVVDFAAGGTVTPLPGADVTVSGDTISAFVPGADLPSASPSTDLVNLWTRQGIDSTMTNQIAEFAPANGDAPITATPEPTSVGLLCAGMLGMATFARKWWAA